MNAVTVRTSLPASREEAFDFLADIRNLPKWAITFCKELKREGGKYKIVTPQGEIFFRIEADRKTGVIDMYGGPTEEGMALWPTRLVAAPDGGTDYFFTAYQSPNMTDEVFQGQLNELRKEMEIVRNHFSSEKTP